MSGPHRLPDSDHDASVRPSDNEIERRRVRQRGEACDDPWPGAGAPVLAGGMALAQALQAPSSCDERQRVN